MPNSPVNTPAEALKRLQEGNYRFVNNLKVNRDLLTQINETKDGQKPFAAILSCMDSRTSAELIFDQGLGDVFSIRVAGNIVAESILGSLEYATAAAGAKLILVLGHTGCGAIKGACDHVEMGNLTSVLNKIQPSIDAETTVTEDRSSNNNDFVLKVTRLNVKHSVDQILEDSPVIRELVESGQIGLVPAMYNIANGHVEFYEPAGELTLQKPTLKAD